MMTKTSLFERPIHMEALDPDSNEPRLLRVHDLLSEWSTEAAARYEAKQTNRLLGPITGFNQVDWSLSGSLAPGLHFVTGAPGTGKTAFTLQIAAQCGFPALYISCEMSPLELLRRITARVTRTFLGRFKTGELTPDKADELMHKAFEAVPELAIGDATIGHANPAWIRTAANATKGSAQHLLIVIDSLHSWVAAGEFGESEYDSLGHGISTLKTISAELNAPILCVSERNRAAMKTGGLGSGAGSRKIEYQAETQFDLNRGDDAEPDVEGFIQTELRLSKNRNGVAGAKIDLKFHGARQEFTPKVGFTR